VALLNGTDTFLWKNHIETLLPKNAAYFWSSLMKEAEWQLIRKDGNPVHRGELWMALVRQRAEAILDELEVPWEIYAGNFYLTGKRVYWSSRDGRYMQDEFR
jgi:hypothetical protein